ncbi:MULTISPECIES: aminotransferase class III-fold pyridoxal phosphate-dependent enzyme [unclassified Pseudomonas]|uniref:aminotransferase class III-fold pyridoxal phosphate-dependent enzyme n=1 Tax=unclassified Pseudomonas TaxID=196821 RepID=UPI000EAA26E7|nr:MULTISPECIES: aminotransferase class III-fold pyridoxal phosphate-dependent enzyme [unclassified Pseudomonas]AYF88889.1 aminotransferase class III-fold pyridoxal phosphate-dependent enzyme [Pseudomonas sp. DY-1]MDH4653420.1 aminotransferase class III-fold pyridoxal phosphate-dependent enzyme [Pseudomonas sp. BN606]MRK22348.1 aminotransferase class III-fold pyridoxal phosphate-dependent enzyme [Pseudomonas sp. JG-B]
MRDALAGLRLMKTVERPDQLFVRGQGSWLWDSEGHAFLDFTQGWAVNSLGHSPSVVVNALKRQAENLINPGPAYYNRGMLELASRLCQASGSDQVYFLNSGAEANEGAIKLARKWGQLHRGGAFGIVTASNSFHGRTLATMSASGKPVFESMFEPKVPGFTKVPYNDLDALAAAVDETTVAVMLEPVQGEAGVIPATLEYFQGVERLCRERGVLLILDEVQTGIGRCGTLLAEELYGIRADIITLGKGLGGGVPLAALLARGNACCFEPGEQGGTYHGNALMTAAGLAVLNTVLESGFLEQVRDVAQHLREGLARVSRRHGHGPLRGHGLMIGLPLIRQSAPLVARHAFAEGLLINAPQPDCLRFTPALTVSRANVDEMLKRLNRAFALAKSEPLEIA